MDKDLLRYLSDHLAGSASAIDVIQSLETHAEDPAKQGFLRELKLKVEKDRRVLKELLEKLGQETTVLADAVGTVTAKASHVKLMWEGLDAGKLGHFEALEMLALGIQGKRLLWVMLGELVPWIPEWQGVDFAELELQAVEQRDAVESLRLEAGVGSLIDSTRRGSHRPKCLT